MPEGWGRRGSRERGERLRQTDGALADDNMHQRAFGWSKFPPDPWSQGEGSCSADPSRGNPRLGPSDPCAIKQVPLLAYRSWIHSRLQCANDPWIPASQLPRKASWHRLSQDKKGRMKNGHILESLHFARSKPEGERQSS